MCYRKVGGTTHNMVYSTKSESSITLVGERIPSHCGGCVRHTVGEPPLSVMEFPHTVRENPHSVGQTRPHCGGIRPHCECSCRVKRSRVLARRTPSLGLGQGRETACSCRVKRSRVLARRTPSLGLGQGRETDEAIRPQCEAIRPQRDAIMPTAWGGRTTNIALHGQHALTSIASQES